MIEFPCGVCQKAVAKTHKAIECDVCKKLIHIKCNKFDENEYKLFQNYPDKCFYCIKCISENVPFSKLNNNEFSISVKKSKQGSKIFLHNAYGIVRYYN